MALLHVDFFSRVLSMCVQMDVILPQETKGQIGMAGKGGRNYPTLYLLHGLSDDHTIWQRRTSIERYVSDMGMAVVMPTTARCWYTDSPSGKYFSYIADELPEICREFFPNMSPSREDTYIAGLSMGGYGAFKIAMSRSERFSMAAASEERKTISLRWLASFSRAESPCPSCSNGAAQRMRCIPATCRCATICGHLVIR